MGRKPVLGLAGLLLASTTLTGCWGDKESVDASAPLPAGQNTQKFGGQNPTTFGSPRPNYGQSNSQGTVVPGPQASSQSGLPGGSSIPSNATNGSGTGTQVNGNTGGSSAQWGGSTAGVAPNTQWGMSPTAGSQASQWGNTATAGSQASQWGNTQSGAMGRAPNMSDPSWRQTPGMAPQSGLPMGTTPPAGMGSSTMPIGSVGVNTDPMSPANSYSATNRGISQSQLRFASDLNKPNAGRVPLSNEVSPPDIARPTPPAGYPQASSNMPTGSAITPTGFAPNAGAMAMPPSDQPPPAPTGSSATSQSRYPSDVHDVPAPPLGVPSVPVLPQGAGSEQ